MKLLLIPCLAVLALLSGGCTKTVEPAPTAGSLDGTIIPAGAVSSITMQAMGGQVYTIIPNRTTGYFAVKNLPEDTYSLAYSAPNYLAPASPHSANVIAGKHTALGEIVLQPVPPIAAGIPSGTMTLTFNDTTYTTTNIGGYIPLPGGNLLLNARFSHGNRIEQFSFRQGAFSGAVGTRQIDIAAANQTTEGNVQRMRVGSTAFTEYRTYVHSQPLSTFTITSYIPATRTITGTFDFRLYTFIGPQPLNTTGTFNLRF